ncbi:MAG: ABC transporter ATP-binding protein [Acholeplasmatales bacterium]|jgi:ATP-binding cassette subfamily B protein|nr:ABC transporter ATP-binding protein/permease [Acholeplasmataceae bacterium]MDY0115604.1 ABC transporter ATP-binding protein [Acholeplasmatales bacterium]MCK9234409.1 ABC transporter ATP-binding protein/permease [Acholeplasmataceae bacterium]MCK9289194.1 ABC transporter ATP-binding protein/permease [Acholeplasmataceae bacterium]MCK9427700.1 ABC transporter ATP-binding protein/permease [Acholeplasmataceae bacterium]
MKRALKYLKPYWHLVTLIFIFVALRALGELALPLFMGKIVGEGLGLKQNSIEVVLNVKVIVKATIYMVLISIASIGITILSGYLEAKVAAGFASDIRKAVYEKIQNYSMSEINYFQTSSLITRSTNDIQQLQNLVNMLLRMIILQPVMAVGAIVMSVMLQPSLSLILVVSVISVLILVSVIFILILPKFKIVQKLVDRMNLTTRENLTGLRVIRAYNTESYQEEKIKKAAKDTKDLTLFVNRINNLMWPVMHVIMGLTSLAIIFFGKDIVFNGGDFEPSDLMVMQQYSMRTVMSFMFITMIFIMIPRAQISANRIMDVLDQEIVIKETNNPKSLPKDLKGEVEFKNVNFKYLDADEYVLCNISFKAKANETTAFIGSTGSGKSTLVNLIPRFFDVSQGEILIDNINIKDLLLDDLHSLIGYVPQKGILFSGTIESNVMFAESTRNLPQEEKQKRLEKAIEIAQASNLVKEKGFDGEIAQGGVNVSGGQRQRLSIARAISKEPLIYIFDDSFSALDYQTDKNLRKALDDNIYGTKIIVAQRINTIRYANQIIVLDKGEIVGKGTHDELLKTNKVYQEIAFSQLSKEELYE